MRNYLLSSAIALSSVLCLPAYARPMTEVDLATMNRVAAPAASSDGRYVAFQMTETDPKDFKRSTGLWLVDRKAPGAAPVRIADHADGNESAPAFHPDGSLYFLAGASGKSQVWRIDPAKPGSAKQVTDTRADVAGFKISPDGTKLIAWGDIPRECSEFGCEAKDKGEAVGPGTGRLYRDKVGFVRHWDSWETPGTYSRPFAFDLVDGQATNPRALDTGLVGDAPSKPMGGGEEIAWGADSRTAFFTLRRADGMEPRSTNLDIFAVDVDAARPPVNLTEENEATDSLPAPSPDGQWLAYAAMERPGYEADRQILMLRNLRTGEVRKLTEAWDRSVGSIAWDPKGTSLYVTAQDVLDHPMFRVDARSGRVERLRATGEKWEGNISEVTPLAGGEILFARNSIAVPTDLWLRNAKGRITRLTDVNRDTLADLDPVSVERLQFRGADGEPVWGQIVKPAKAQSRLPIAFLVHGGPQSSFGNSWSTRWNPRLFASPGYAAVTIDFHGSAGYGQAFTDSINKDWGGKPLEDLKLGLAAAGRFDPQLDTGNACALGGSYGGYMMNWIAGNWPDGFKCLVNHAGVFDLRAMAFETEETWFDEWDHGGPWWSRPDAEKWNPVHHVTKWKTPMLVIHGEKDFRIPYTQSLAAFHALQRQGVKGELLIFPDENHWILKGQNSVQWYRTVFDWLGRHLAK